MSRLDEITEFKKKETHYIDDTIRHRAVEFSKGFKTSWVGLGQTLYAIHQDKLYHAWGYEKFEKYTEGELGIAKPIALKLLKTYLFLEESEPQYLELGFAEGRDPNHVPGYDEMNVLRLARTRKELTKDDYAKLRSDIFEKGKVAGEVRKDLTTMMKERKQVDPEEERENRSLAAIRRMLNSIRSFQKDMEVLKLIPNDILEEAKGLQKKLENQIS